MTKTVYEREIGVTDYEMVIFGQSPFFRYSV